MKIKHAARTVTFICEAGVALDLINGAGKPFAHCQWDPDTAMNVARELIEFAELQMGKSEGVMIQ